MTEIETFGYSGHTVQIVPEERAKGIGYWFVIDGRPITFVSSSDTAKRLATKFIDVVDGEEFLHSRKGMMTC